MPTTNYYIKTLVLHTVRERRQRWRSGRAWRYGLWTALISGGCNGVLIFFASPEAFKGWGTVFKTMAITGIGGAILYLKQSPLQPLDPTTTPSTPNPPKQ